MENSISVEEVYKNLIVTFEGTMYKLRWHCNSNYIHEYLCHNGRRLDPADHYKLSEYILKNLK